MPRRHWLVKSDPDTFSWDDLAKAPGKTTCWDGVRNYQARNFLRDEIREGDGVLFYHSQANPKAVVGTCSVTRAGHPDPTQFDKKSKGYDPGSERSAPRWYAIDLRAESRFARPVAIDEMRETHGLEAMVLLRRGRLSVQPVTPEEWKIIVKLGSA